MAPPGRWGDLLEEDEELPPSTTSGPDAKGLITKGEFFRNDKGEVVKRTTKIRTVKIERRVFAAAVDRRRTWAKFGEAATERATDSITAKSVEEVPFERLRPVKPTQEEKNARPDFQSAMAGSDKAAIAGSLRDMLYKKRMERQLLAAQGLYQAPEMDPEEGEGGLAPPGAKPGTWVPSSLRNRGPGAADELAQKRRDENSVRVTNLSEDVTDADLHELFGAFGHVARVFVARDRETGESRGFAFVNFVHRDEAQRAIDRLDGYGYDSLILSVSWAAPREERK